MPRSATPVVPVVQPGARGIGGAPLPTDEVPVARRSFFEIRRSAPLQSPLMATAYFRDLEFYLLSGAAYTLDGDTWHPYEDPDTEIKGGGLAPELAEFFDLNMITVTVHSDGRVEWDEDDELSEADIRHGNGLCGMRERAQLHRGRVEAGPRHGGGFGVHAALPYGPGR